MQTDFFLVVVEVVIPLFFNHIRMDPVTLLSSSLVLAYGL